MAIGQHANTYIDVQLLPWPPPAPTSIGELGRDLQLRGSFGSIDGQLRQRLMRRGYEKLRYFTVPRGFALTTEVERLAIDGRPHRDRWLRGKSSRVINFIDYMKLLVAGEDGRFRLLMFIVTDENFRPAHYAPAQTDLDRWEETGQISLSPRLAATPAPSGTRAWLLVYEFRTSKAKSAQLVAQRNGFPFRLHRQFAGFQ